MMAHTEYHYDVCITWWGNGHAVQTIDEADAVEVSGPGQWPLLRFELPQQKHDFDRVLALLKHAYERGAARRSAEIGELFKKLVQL